ncbi:MAG: BatD family protein [Bacteroidetes bacterium]|nr:BatD family protein [Bacteroidota bacterium]
MKHIFSNRLTGIATLLFLLMHFSVSAADATLTATVSQTTLAVGEQVEVTFTLNGNGSNFHAPPFTDFNLLMGPNQSTSMQFVNGSVSQTISYTYVLQAVKEGTFKFGSATMDAGGKKITSNQVTITVVKGNAPAKQQQGNPQGSQQGSDATVSGGKNIFLKATVDKSNVFQGEGIVVTYKLFVKAGVSLANYGLTKPPSLNGFWSQDINPAQQQAQFHTENYDGANYKVADVKKIVVFAQRSGTLELDPMEADAIVQVQVKRQQRSNDPFSQFFNDPFFNFNQWQNVKIQLKSEPVKITVKALPPNAPATFNGAVGKFTLEADLDKNETKAHEPVTLKIKVTGKGNMKLIEAPKIDFPSEFETYDPKINSNISATTAGVSGSKTFEYLIIPRNAGEFKIPVNGFTFYDLEKKQYQTIPSQDLIVKVGKGNETITTTVTGVNKSDVQLLGKDIRFIKTNNPEFISVGHSIFGSGIFYSMMAAPALLFVLLLLFRKRYMEMQSNTGLLKSQRANKVAKKRLAAAQKFLTINEKEKFLDEMFRALWGFISDKLQIPVSELSKESASESLRSKNIPEQLVTQFNETIDSCEYARFAPGMTGSNEEIYRKGIEVISKLEVEIKS